MIKLLFFVCGSFVVNHIVDSRTSLLDYFWDVPPRMPVENAFFFVIPYKNCKNPGGDG